MSVFIALNKVTFDADQLASISVEVDKDAVDVLINLRHSKHVVHSVTNNESLYGIETKIAVVYKALYDKLLNIVLNSVAKRKSDKEVERKFYDFKRLEEEARVLIVEHVDTLINNDRYKSLHDTLKKEVVALNISMKKDDEALERIKAYTEEIIEIEDAHLNECITSVECLCREW